jgi:regulator of replication initiation timing
MERIELADGRTLMGLIESVDDRWVHMLVIKREPGRRTQLVVRPVERSAVVRMERLPEPDRVHLQERVAVLAFHARIEAARMEAVELEKKVHNKIPVFLYAGRWFSLESNLPEQMTRRVIVRLEQIFSGYRQLLPPRTESHRPLRIQIFSSRMEYEEAIGRYGVRLANPAVFLPKENLVLAGTELGQVAAQLQQLEEEHARLRQELNGLREQLANKLEQLGRKLRQQGIPRQEAAKILQRERLSFDNQIAQKLADIHRVDRKNTELFSQIMEQTLRQLYHEAFHAYMENYLFPSSQYQVPLWLQEGLAMLFQEGIVEADNLRLDAISQEAASLIRKDRRQGATMPLEQLLGAGSTEFLQAPGAGSALGNRYYAYAWAAVYYLCQTERLNLARLEAYLSPAAQGLTPQQRLERLLGMDPARWEQDWQKFLQTL